MNKKENILKKLLEGFVEDHDDWRFAKESNLHIFTDIKDSNLYSTLS